MARGRHGQDDAEFRRRVDAARGRVALSDVAGRYTKLTRFGRELGGLCPFHKEKSPSFRVNDAKATYYCFGCGAFGDVIKFLVKKAGLSFMDALRDIEGGTYAEVDPAERARRTEEDAADREAAIAEARRIWDDASEAADSPAEVYARSRGIIMPLPPSIRFTRVYAWIDRENGEVGPDLPALIGAVTDGNGEVIGLQRIFLAKGGHAKASMRKPKKSLGRIRGGALRLDHAIVRDAWANEGVGLLPPDDPRSEVIITEGPEDGLSLAQEMPARRVWVALGTAMMPEVQFPPEVRSIVIAGQNDKAGHDAVKKAGEALAERGFGVRTMFPAPEFKDWNDQLRGIRK
ncbi:DUF7146 domain-containing protein [Sphingomonas sanxanigenens]|uniref:Zinc finger CHC2-type domain-containing protein n=1 Tax=Sphingomonas sanxanigenens DSM 19645 = NX02 TaxID=1123269 RepID=W0AGX8_9SPHN|nr:CHC2 zinc finger domain-containing protein [Sphingomonas sanxanigenens]AHE55523.1 hypothetical protein NX02_19295 [Sphingomonas sanxanigenens DSM 19645 = NX02]